MATITATRPRLRDPEVTGFRYPVDSAVTAIVAGDLLTIDAQGELALATAGAGAVNLVLAAHKYPDAHYEPVSETQPAEADIVFLRGKLVEINVAGVLAKSNYGQAYDISIASGVPKVNLASQVNAAFVIVGLADPLYGGVIGDTDVRVVGYFLDSKCAEGA